MLIDERDHYANEIFLMEFRDGYTGNIIGPPRRQTRICWFIVKSTATYDQNHKLSSRITVSSTVTWSGQPLFSY